MVETSFSDENILNIFSGGSLLPGHTVCKSEVATLHQAILEELGGLGDAEPGTIEARSRAFIPLLLYRFEYL